MITSRLRTACPQGAGRRTGATSATRATSAIPAPYPAAYRMPDAITAMIASPAISPEASGTM